MKEQRMLFAYIEQLELAGKSGSRAAAPMFGRVKNPVRMMMMEHDSAGELLRKMRQVTNEYRQGKKIFHRKTALLISGMKHRRRDLRVPSTAFCFAGGAGGDVFLGLLATLHVLQRFFHLTGRSHHHVDRRT
jgi:hypothetical protein